MSRVKPLAALAAWLLVAACGADESPKSRPVTPGISTDYAVPSDIDDEAIAFTVHEPAVRAPGKKVPLILHSHGYGGSRVKAGARPAPGDADTLGRLLDAGYGVISIDQRGHGDSGGQVRILDPDFEGKDLIQVIDWAEANLDWLAYRGGNLLLGAIGGSYGGGYQHLIYATDPEHRLDAIAPEITWHDLRYSLYSGGAFKSFWAVFLSALGTSTRGGQHQDVNEGLANGLTMNSLTDEQQALLKKVSLVSHCEAGTLEPIDALYWQSAGDTLFNLNDAVNNFRCVSALGGDVRLLVKNGGHDSLVGGTSGEQCGALLKTQSIVDWYDEKLKGIPRRADYIPQFCFHMNGSADDGVVVDDLPVGGEEFAVAPQSVMAQDGTETVTSVLLTTVGAGGAVLAGIPTVHLSVTDPTGLDGDPIIFLGLAKRAAGTTTDTLLMANQVRPFRGFTGAEGIADELTGVSARLAEGDEVRLLIYSSYAARYAGSGSDAPTPVSVSATVGLPLHAGDLPVPAANEGP